MDRPGASRHLPLAIGAALLSLLAVLATLQYRWIGQGSVLESQRLRSALATAGSQLAEDFDREIARAFLAFHPPASGDEDLAARLARQTQRWRAEAPYPRLLRGVYRVRFAGAPELEVLRLDPPRLVAVAWPAELQGLRRRLAGAGAPAWGLLPPVAADVPGLLVPAARGRASPRDGGPPAASPGIDSLFLWLDAGTMAREIFPQLTRRHFGSPRGTHDALAVLDRDDPSRILFLSDPRLPAGSFRTGDVTVPIFRLRFDALRSLAAGAGQPPAPGRRWREDGMEPGPPGPEEGFGAGGAWNLVIKRRGLSLADAVRRYRFHNLAISAAILALVAITTGLMMANAQQARLLARQQMEFVAAVSHELRTPVAAILSAGQNLADGVVAEPAQVRRYGALIEREGRRLSGMVGQVLDFAGIQSGRHAYTLQATRVEQVLEAAIDDCRGLLDERQARVERDVVPGLPPVQADPAALRRALRNLIENAAKYGGPDPWIGVRARPQGSEVEITVEDRGIGVDREDVPHLFEPFFRGREAVGRSIAGSGLGLSVVDHIVRAHRGRVSFATAGRERGSAFTLHLPVAGESIA